MASTTGITLPLPVWVPSATNGGTIFEVYEPTEGHQSCAHIAMTWADDAEDFADQKLFVEFGTGNQYTLQELGEAYGNIAWKADTGSAGDTLNQYAPYQTENQRIAEDALLDAQYQLREADRFLAAAQHEGAVNKGKQDKAAAEVAVTHAERVLAYTNEVTTAFMIARD